MAARSTHDAPSDSPSLDTTHRRRRALLWIAVALPAAVAVAWVAPSLWCAGQLSSFTYLFALAASGLMLLACPAGRKRRAGQLLAVLAAAFVLQAAAHYQMLTLRFDDADWLVVLQWRTLLRQSLMLAGLLVVLGAMLHVLRWPASRLFGPAGRWPNRLAAGTVRGAVLAVFAVLVALPWLFVFIQMHRPSFDYPRQLRPPHRDLAVEGLPPGWVVPASTPSCVTVLVVHGIGSDMSDTAFVDLFHELGAHVVTIDLPGSGRAAGTGVSFGLRESRAIARVAHHLRDHPLPGQQTLIGFGPSMGGTSMLLAAEAEPGLFDGLIIESAYSSLRSIARHQPLFRYADNPLVKAIEHVTLLAATFELGASVDDVDVLPAIRRLDGLPKLFIQSRDDRVVPPAETQTLFAASGGLKRIERFDGPHLTARLSDPVRYDAAVGWLFAQAAGATSRPDTLP